MISIIHPSRSRPKKAKETAENWLSNAGADCQYILSVDSDDPKLFDYNLLGLGPHFCLPTIEINKNRSAVDAINAAAKVSRGDILIVISDDFDCPPLWGKQILNATVGAHDWIMKTPDGIQDWIITLPIMDRAYYERFGYIYYPEYLHMFCDTELSCVADLTGRRINANIPFKHNHYSVTKEAKDEVSIKADSTWNQGEKLFLERYKRQFNLPTKDIQGRITNQGYLNWINSKT